MARRLALVLALIPAALLAQREPILKQVDVPHAYYWREMYVPQVTSGPSAATWSPDGTELIYSMDGSLWRQRIGVGVARQLTSGPAYDYQPDWSPDGRTVVFARYARDAIELQLLDLESGRITPLTANGAVNVEPRWSPDGTRIAFVSTLFNQRWHLFTVPPSGSAPQRLTEDNDSKLPRYYYSRWDHYLSPAWSPDGKELVLVSNRGHIHGTGGFWRMEARPGAAMREIRYEETTWKARPDWSPDGTRIVYSSYLGRAWNQLWIMPSEGGDPFPLTYGDFDATAPRWSRDGKRIAFISNESGNTGLWVLDVVGGARQAIVPAERRYRDSVGTLQLEIRDTGGRLIPARVSVTTAEGRGYAPAESWRHADEAFDRHERRFEYSYFHANGTAALTIPAGPIHVEVWHGPEFRVFRGDFTVPAGGSVVHRVMLQRLVNLPASGWWSGDVHVHMNYGGAYRNTPRNLSFQARAEDLHVVENLIVNKEQRIPDIAYFRTDADPVSTATFLLMHGQEFHTSVWGHMGLLGLHSHYLVPDYVGYPNTAAASLAPMNADVADLAHAAGALVGYVHPFDEQVHHENAAEPLSNELPVDVALGKVDYIEIVGFADHRITAGIGYRLLNLGFRLPAAGGTDAMANFASLRGPVGMNRVYVKVRRPGLDVGEWLASLKAGQSFATNGPLLDFALGGEPIGGELRLAAGRAVPYRAHLASIVPVDHLEIVCNGRVLRTIRLAGARTAAEESGTLPLRDSGWCVLRASSDGAEYPVLDNYVYATTSPVYVTIAGRAPRSSADAAWFGAWIDRVREATERYPDWNSPAEKAAVLARLAAAHAVYERLR